MPAKKAPTGTHADLDLSALLPCFADEDLAREFFEAQRWPNGPVCPHCESVHVTKLEARNGSKSHVRPGAYQCNDCREQFTVRVGSVMEDSKLPIRKWLMAFHLMTCSKKGVSSHQIARQLKCTQKTAWFLCHRIREAMKDLRPTDGGDKLNGEVEVDESYIGGKPRRHLEGQIARGEVPRYDPHFSYQVDANDKLAIFKDGAELLRLPHGEMDDEVHFTFEVAFGEPKVIEGKPVIPFLRQLSGLVNSVVEGCASFL